MKKNKMSGEFILYGEQERFSLGFGGESKWKEPIWKT
jgi:hypothetical protein